MLVYIVLILLPASVMLYLYYNRSTQILEEEVSRSIQQTLKQAGINLSYRMNHIEDLSNSLFMNRRLYNDLNRSGEIGEQIEQSKDLRNLLESVQTKSEIVRARVFTDPANIYGSDMLNIFPLQALKSYSWYKPIMDAGGGIVWTGNYTESYLDTGDQSIFSVGRMLRNPRHYEQTVGVLMIDVSVSMITDILSELDLPSQRTAYLVDRSGTIIYHENDGLIGTKDTLGEETKLIGTSEDGIIRHSDGKEVIYDIYTTIQPMGWKLISEVPKSDISHRTSALNQLSGVVTLIGMSIMFLIFSFFLMTFIEQGMNRRIRAIVKSIRTEGIERLDHIRPSSDSPFYLLEHSVDHLIHRVKGLMEETYSAKMQEREAQLRALQAQINPHFLYNTLDTINWLAIAREATDISAMIEGLSDYFRLSLNKGRDNVSLKDELELARVYLEIQQNRFPASFTFEIEAGLETGNYMIPKLTLQPIVENALLHGIRKARGKKGMIRLLAILEGEDLLLAVSDDGIGMNKETVDNLLSASRPEPTPAYGNGSSYGLYNVDERIKLFAGNAYGLKIRSIPGEGTTVTVRLKAVRRNNE
jgi:Predicted signal transduction protein with a C-terminal ATPase domain